MTDHGDKVHILLVDDEVELLAASASALKRRGFIVSTAHDGESALGMLQSEAIDVAVLDVRMPGMSGDELFGLIKRKWPDIPVLMLTGHASVQHAFKSSRQGVVEYLAKPCDIDRLANVARRVVAERRLASEGTNDTRTDEGIRVMVIDDEQELLDVLYQTLSRRGMQVATARSGAAALVQLARQDADVVLLDLKLQGEHGLDILAKIKRLFPATEVIIHTGHPSAESAVDGFHGGAFDFLPKPADMRKLLSKIRAAHRLRLQRTQDQSKQAIQDIRERQPD